MARLRLLTRADDAGLSRTVNRAIVAATREGIVRNISLMAPAPDIGATPRAFGAIRDRVDFGFHLCLTAEWENLRWGPVAPASKVPALVQDDNTFYTTTAELAAQSPSADQLMTEVRAQYEALVNLGFELSYLDEHMLVGTVPGLTPVLEAFCNEKGLIYNRRLADEQRYLRLPGWNGPGEHPGTELADQLAATAPGTYLVVGHPGYKDVDVLRLKHPDQELGDEGLKRNRQRRMFMDIEIVDYCETAGVKLLRYTEL